MSRRKKPEQLVKSLDRALDILEKIVQSEEELGVTELSNSLGLHKSTTYRLLATLAYRGYVSQDPKNNKYTPGIKLFEMGNMALNRLELRKEVRPFLTQLMHETGETVHLGILEDNEVIYIDKVESSQTIRMYSKIGKRAPVHCTGLGKVLLAYSPEDKVREIINEGLTPFTRQTITDEEAFREHLKEIKIQGYALDNGEHEDGIRCVAGPIFDHTGEVIASFSISGPTMRVTEEKVGEYIQLIKSYSSKMSRALGYFARE